MKKLITFITPSRRLNNIKELFDNIETTAFDPSCVEVLVKFDDDQKGVTEFIENEIKKRPFSIRYIVTPRLEGIYSVWVAMEQLFFMTDPDCYFIQIISDEPRFLTPHWDKLLRNYIGFFKDHVFRLRLSTMKFANYASHYECTFRPDSFPIYTRRWLELTEGTGDCWGSDAYQQCVAFQLSLGPGSYTNFYREDGLCRDVVVYDIKLGGLEFCVGVSSEEQRERNKRNLKEWSRLTKFQMQEHFSYLARRINAYIWAEEHEIKDFQLVKNGNRKTVSVVSLKGQKLIEFNYAVPRLVVYAQNTLRYFFDIPRQKIIACGSFVKRRYQNLKNWMWFSYEKVIGCKKKIGKNTLSFKKQIENNDAGLSGKKRLKKMIRQSMTTLWVPFNMVSNYFDKLYMSKPPGISVLFSKNPAIPKGIQKPRSDQIKWLQDELKEQNDKKKELRKKIFMTTSHSEELLVDF